MTHFAPQELSYFRHALELNHIVELEHWSVLYNISSSMTALGYSQQNMGTAILFIALYGLVLRVLTIVIFVLW